MRRVRNTGLLPMFIVDYFFQYHVCPLLLSGKGERSVPPIRTPARIADKTNFEPPDEIRHTGCEFVIPKGALSLGTYRSVSNLFRFTNESNSMSRKALLIVSGPDRILFFFTRDIFSLNPSLNWISEFRNVSNENYWFCKNHTIEISLF